MNVKTFFAFDPEDTEEIRIEKFAAFLVAASCCFAGLIWSAMYYFIFGWGLTALLPLLFVLIVGSAIVVSHVSKNHHYAVYAQIICIMYITTFIHLSIGGLFESGFVMTWAFLGPLTALMFFSLRQSTFWFLLYLSSLVIIVVFDGYFASRGQLVTESTKIFFFIMNLGFASAVVFIFASYFVGSAINEREKANRLLLNVLPKEIALILKAGDKTIADHIDSASVLFADIVNFTPLSAQMTPIELVELLNAVFSHFDTLVERYELEKIKTIGDCYMVAAGVPRPRPDHAHLLVRMALDVQDYIARQEINGRRIKFRIGINSGPVVAGVIGRKKFIYDLWGDAVNTASRMESHGSAGVIQITRATYEIIKDQFVCEPRGIVNVKGKGGMEVWHVKGERLEAMPLHAK